MEIPWPYHERRVEVRVFFVYFCKGNAGCSKCGGMSCSEEGSRKWKRRTHFLWVLRKF